MLNAAQRLMRMLDRRLRREERKQITGAFINNLIEHIQRKY